MSRYRRCLGRTAASTVLSTRASSRLIQAPIRVRVTAQSECRRVLFGETFLRQNRAVAPCKKLQGSVKTALCANGKILKSGDQKFLVPLNEQRCVNEER